MDYNIFINGIKDKELCTNYIAKFRNKYNKYEEQEFIERNQFIQEQGITEEEFVDLYEENWIQNWYFIGERIEEFYSEMGWEISILCKSKPLLYSSEYDAYYKNYVLQDIWAEISREKNPEYACWEIMNLIPILKTNNKQKILKNDLEKLMAELFKYPVGNTVIDEKILTPYIKENHGFESIFGKIEIDISQKLGQGGNGVVYCGKLNDKDVAVKFLLNYSEKRKKRFMAEYLNIKMAEKPLNNIVECYHMDELIVNDCKIPYIIMKKYKTSLKKYRGKLDEITWDQVEKLFKNLCKTINSIEQNNIIHRDLKPENILLDNDNNYIVCDFGIAHFDNNYPIKNLTTKGERLANFEFCAPEQINNGVVSSATDIYALGQIMYWFVFGTVNRGTGGQKISELYNEKASVLDTVIYKCIANKAEDRFQNIIEIEDLCKQLRNQPIDVFDDMRIFNEVIRKSLPEAYNKPFCTTNSTYIENLIKNINSTKFKRELWYNTGIANNEFEKIIILDNGNYIILSREIIIEEVWAYVTDSCYNDVLIFKIKNPDYYKIDDKSYDAIAFINKELIVPIDRISSGYFRFEDGHTESVNNLNIEERYTYIDHDDDEYIVIGVQEHCSIILENDGYVSGLQEEQTLSPEKIMDFKKNITRKKTRNVEMRL